MLLNLHINKGHKGEEEEEEEAVEDAKGTPIHLLVKIANRNILQTQHHKRMEN